VTGSSRLLGLPSPDAGDIVSAPPIQLAPVVVVVDRSSSGTAVRYGAAESLRTGRPLRLVHVAPPGDSWLRTVGLDSLRRALTMADAEVVGRVPVHSALLRGDGLHETAQVAATAAVVVLEQLLSNAHRRPTESVAAALAAVTDTPVVVVPNNWVERHRGVVTVGLDPAAADDTAVRAAMAVARLRNSVLRVVVAGTADRADADARLERLGGDGCDLALEVTPASPAAALEAAAASSDLMVVGRHRPQLPDESRLGSLAQELLARVSCPVLLTAPGHVHRRRGAPGPSYQPEYDVPAHAG
jgi:nucleotide-binding universal stress UspA family protein